MRLPVLRLAVYGFRLSSFVGLFLLAALAGGPQLRAQTAHFSYATEPIGNGEDPAGVAVDSSGNVYLSSVGGISVLKETPQPDLRFQETQLNPSGQFVGIAVDAAGNLYLSGAYNYVLLKETLQTDGSYVESTIASGLNQPMQVTVDSSGNVYVADEGSTSDNGEVLKEAPQGNGTYTQTIVASGLAGSAGVAVDGAGNLYIATSAGLLKETLQGDGSYLQSTIVADACFRVALDREGDIFLASGNEIIEETPQGNGSYAQTTLNNLMAPLGGENIIWGMAVDAQGNLYIANALSEPALRVELGRADFGTVAVSASGPVQSVTFTFDSGGSLGSLPAVLTQGAASPQEFTDAGTGSCTTNGTGYAYNAGDTCTVDVVFSPQHAGVRTGAVVLYGANGSPIATAYLHGVGSAPVVALAPGSATIASGSAALDEPFNAAVDGAGNLYVSNYQGNSVTRITPGGSASVVSTGAITPGVITGVAVDGAGNLYLADNTNSQIIEVTPTGSASVLAITGLSTGLSLPTALAFDGSGNLYIADYGNNRVVMVAPSGAGSVVNAGGYSFADFGITGLAVDGAGNIYAIDRGHNAVVKITPAGSASVLSTPNLTLSNPQGVAVDPAGDVYIADSGNNRVVEVPVSGAASVVALPGIMLGGKIFGLTLDAGENLYIADFNNNRVIKLNTSTASLSFQNTEVNATSSDSPEIATVSNVGTIPLTLPTPVSGINPSLSTNFTFDDATTCGQVMSGSAPATLQPGSSCALAVDFTPQLAGAISGSIVLTDNALNTTSPNYATQDISLAGYGGGRPQSISFTAAPALSYGATPIQLSATASSQLPVTFSVVSGPGAISGSTLTITGVGSVVVAANQAGNTEYQAAPEATETFVVSPAVLTLTASNATRTYGAANPAASVTVSGAVNGDSFSVGYSTSATPASAVGTYPIVPTAQGANLADYALNAVNGTLTVSPAPLTVTAANATRAYGAANLAFTGSYSGAVNGDTFTVSGSTTATAASPAGSYPVTPTVAGAKLGSYTVTAVNGTLSVVPAPVTMKVAASATSAAPGQSVTFSAAIASTTIGTPTGTVTFYDNSTLLGTAALVAGQASLAVTTLADGAHSITAAYSGDANFLASNSSGIALLIATQDFTLTPLNSTGTSQTVAAGGSANYSFNVTPTSGSFPGAVSFSVSGLPSGTTATFSPASLAANSAGGPVQLSVQTAGASTAGLLRPGARMLMLAGLLLPFAGVRRLRRLRGISLVAVLMLGTGLAVLAGCGGSNEFVQGSQSYAISVTATSAGVDHTIDFTLQVQ